MVSFLVLMVWMASGAICAVRGGDAGWCPVAVIFGPLWLPIATEILDDASLPAVTPR